MHNQIKEMLKLLPPERGDINGLIDFLECSDFYTAPASTRFHLSVKGGLALHSWNVYMHLKKICALYYPTCDTDSIIVCGLLHDICKVNFYSTEVRNRKNESGVWEKYMAYTVADKDPLGHGEKSVILIQDFIRLSREEQMAIRWHMGAWSADGEQKLALQSAIEKSPLVLCLITADSFATALFEGKDGNK